MVCNGFESEAHTRYIRVYIYSLYVFYFCVLFVGNKDIINNGILHYIGQWMSGYKGSNWGIADCGLRVYI
jgi:hypothetical protein